MAPRPPPGARGRGAAARGTGSRAWAQLSAEIRRCTACPLSLTRRQAVVYRGAEHPRVVFIGEAPGAEEDRVGQPFVGRAGRRLDAAIAQLGLREPDVGIVNVVKCRPPGNRFVRRAAEACHPFLVRQLRLLHPDLIVTLGAHALEALDPGAPKITECAGSLRAAGALPLVPLLHPAAALHAPRLRARWESDLVRLQRHLGSRSLGALKP